jgi:hypothetical protein
MDFLPTSHSSIFNFVYKLELFQPGYTKFLHSKLLQSGQNRLPPFQAITVRQKPTSSIPFQPGKSSFIHSTPFGPSRYSMAHIVDKSSLLSLPSRSWGDIHQMFLQFFYDFSTIFFTIIPCAHLLSFPREILVRRSKENPSPNLACTKFFYNFSKKLP